MVHIRPSSRKIKAGDIVGQRTVLGCAFSRGVFGEWWFVVQCSCGEVNVVPAKRLRGVDNSRCRTCFYKSTVKHGESGTRLHRIWNGMRARCKDLEDKDYGGRGITVCEEWEEYLLFRDWALSHGYRDDLEIDREKNHLGYFPENCRWVTHEVNSNNRRPNR